MGIEKVTFTFDLEDSRPDSRYPMRYDLMTRRVLDFLKSMNVRGTFFVVGRLARDNPDLVRDVAAAGHEIALHSWDHTPIPDQTPEEFMDHTRKGKSVLEEITGQAVIGYRAPIFSLVQDSLWAVDILKQLGFQYSSSILPAANPLYGFPEKPSEPFVWENGLYEFPAPVHRFGPLILPFLGGFYMRYLPFFLIEHAIKKSSGSGLWTYAHPYDFDPEEAFFKMKGASFWVSALLWLNRKNTFKKFEKLFEYYESAGPLKDLLDDRRIEIRTQAVG